VELSIVNRESNNDVESMNVNAALCRKSVLWDIERVPEHISHHTNATKCSLQHVNYTLITHENFLSTDNP
jgi:hypothetical protein